MAIVSDKKVISSTGAKEDLGGDDVSCAGKLVVAGDPTNTETVRIGSTDPACQCEWPLMPGQSFDFSTWPVPPSKLSDVKVKGAAGQIVVFARHE